MIILLLVICIFAVLTITLAICEKDQETMYCIMVTGKNGSREQLAKHALVSFNRQTYRNKVLVIMNHGEYSVKSKEDRWPNIVEVHVDRNTVLGSMRNASIDLIPSGCVFAVFDDDDYRSDNYLQVMKNAMDSNGADLVCCANRLECNLKNNFVWKTYLRKGLPNTIVARKTDNIRYKNLQTMEDTSFIADYAASGRKVLVIDDNDPKIYIRTVHGDNTSLYADPDKSFANVNGTNFREVDASPRECEYVQSKIRLVQMQSR